MYGLRSRRPASPEELADSLTLDECGVLPGDVAREVDRRRDTFRELNAVVAQPTSKARVEQQVVQERDVEARGGHGQAFTRTHSQRFPVQVTHQRRKPLILRGAAQERLRPSPP